MFESINEAVDVIVKFARQKVVPVKFRWRNREYPIHRLNLLHSHHQGRELIHVFSVSNDDHVFTLSFHTASLSWKLNDMYYA